MTVEPARMLTAFESLLADRQSCPVCKHVEEAQRSFFSWLGIENYSSAEVQARLRAGMGMCPPHSRRLIEEIGEGYILATVMREALAGARQTLRGERRPGPCLACDAVAGASERARQTVLVGLLDPGNARRYAEHAGLCLAHVVGAAATAEPSTLGIIAERLLGTLREGDDRGPEVLAGSDPDAPRRAAWRDGLPDVRTADCTVAGLCDRIGIDACPVCLSRGLEERLYVQWFLDRSRINDPSIRTDPGELCSVHLQDVALADRTAASRAIERQRTARQVELERLLDRLAELPPTTGRRRRPRPEDLDRARGEFTSPHHCSACNSGNSVERSQLELLTASLELTPVRERYERSHGLCVRHATQVTADQPARLTRRHADARVGVLAWEVRETSRKYAWAYRHEETGPEHDAWARALTQIDGRVFAGGSAPRRPEQRAEERP